MGTDSVRGPQGELPLSRLAGVQSAAETVARVLQTADSSLHPKEVVKRTVSHLVDATAFDLRDKRDGSLTGFAFKYSQDDLTGINIARYSTSAELRTAVSMTLHGARGLVACSAAFRQDRSLLRTAAQQFTVHSTYIAHT